MKCRLSLDDSLLRPEGEIKDLFLSFLFFIFYSINVSIMFFRNYINNKIKSTYIH